MAEAIAFLKHAAIRLTPIENGGAYFQSASIRPSNTVRRLHQAAHRVFRRKANYRIIAA